jgi:threonylcarbamoyladenosine tRNA methylthiotransferase MtaB
VTFAILTLGCRVNQADSLGLETDLGALGGTVAAPDQADVVVVNSCSVTAGADQGTRQAVRRVHRRNPAAKIVVTGCYASRSAEEIAMLPGVVRVVGNAGKEQLASLVTALSPRTTAERFGWGDGACGAPVEPGIAGRTAWTLGVQTGCDEPCAYCIIPTTRGQPRSRPVDAVVAEAERVASWGFREIAITGVHLGAWGRDLDPPRRLVDLLDGLAARDLPVRYRLSSLEPMDCTHEVIDRLAADARFAPHLHLPMQHASSRVLTAMRRPYDGDWYARLVERVRARLPDAAIGTDVIVGFPGEHDEDFEKTRTYLAGAPLTYVHVFPYSDRPGTEAAHLGGKVHGATIRARADELRTVARALAKRFQRSQVGRVRPGLTLEDGTLVVTDNYLKVRVPAGVARNVFVNVRIDAATPGGLAGTVAAPPGS